MCTNPKFKIMKGKDYGRWSTVEEFTKGNAIMIKCTKCYECRLFRMYRLLSMLFCELKSRDLKKTYIYFITLTYDQENYDDLKHRYYIKNLQNMIKDWRRRNDLKNLKYIITSELGSKRYRLHHHGLIISDKPFIPPTSGGRKIHGNYYYNNSNIHWKFGFHTISEINTLDDVAIQKTFKYVLKYTLKSPLNTLISKNIGRAYIDQVTDKEGKFIVNGHVFQNPWVKRFLTNDEIIRNNLKYNKDNKKIKEKFTFYDDKEQIEFIKW